MRYFLGADMGAEEIVRPMGGSDLDRMFALGDSLGEPIAESAGKDCRIANAKGTDVTFTRGKPQGFALAKATGPGGYFVPGTATIYPEMESVKRSVVTSNMFHEYYSRCARYRATTARWRRSSATRRPLSTTRCSTSAAGDPAEMERRLFLVRHECLACHKEFRVRRQRPK